MFKQLEQNVQHVQTDFPLINAVLHNKQEGKIFSDDSALFVLHKAGFSFLQTSADFNNYKSFIEFLLNSKAVPVYFHFYNPPQKLIDECSTNAFMNIKVRTRIHLKFTGSNIFDEVYPLPENYSIQKISENNFQSLYAFNLDIDNKFWNSKDDFLNNGFGFCVCNENNEPVSVCYTACMVNNQVEIDIATLESYQQKGLAKLAAQYFIKYCIDNNIIVNWDCFEDNVGSFRLANKLGLKRLLCYNFLSVFNKRKAA